MPYCFWTTCNMADPTRTRYASYALAALLATASAWSWAACPPVTAAFGHDPAAEGLRAHPLALELDGEGVLLGLRGERVPARGALIAVANDGDPTPRFWTEDVDWSVYGSAPGKPGTTILQRDADGRLCRIDRKLNRGGRQIDNGGYRLAYDAQGRLSAYAEFSSALEGASLQSQACVTRDSHGAISAVYLDNCATTPTHPVHFVRNADGQLLRTIDLRAGTAGAVVRSLNADGTLRAVYRSRPDPDNPGALLAYAEPQSKADRVLAVPAGASPVVTTEIPDEPWRVVRVPADTLNDDALPSWDPAVQTVLFDGRSNAQGQVVLAPEQIAPFHQALHDTPGRVFLYAQPMTRFLPVTALGAQTWAACVDPSRRDAKACD